MVPRYDENAAGEFREAAITVRGVRLTDAQSMAVRCAMSAYLTQLADEEFAAALGPIAGSYRARLSEVQRLILSR